MMPVWFSFVDMAFLGVALLFAWGGFQKGFAGQVAHIMLRYLSWAMAAVTAPMLIARLLKRKKKGL